MKTGETVWDGAGRGVDQVMTTTGHNKGGEQFCNHLSCSQRNCNTKYANPNKCEVAMKTIEERLNEQLNEKDRQIANLKREIESLNAREAIVGHLKADFDHCKSKVLKTCADFAAKYETVVKERDQLRLTLAGFQLELDAKKAENERLREHIADMKSEIREAIKWDP